MLDEQHRISDVMLGGVWHVRDNQQQIYGQFEARDASASGSATEDPEMDEPKMDER